MIQITLESLVGVAVVFDGTRLLKCNSEMVWEKPGRNPRVFLAKIKTVMTHRGIIPEHQRMDIL